MRMKTSTVVTVFAIFACGVLIGGAFSDAQPLKPEPSAQYKYVTAIPPGIAAPDSVETRLGTLQFFDGFPDPATAEKLYDNLDFQRAVQGYLLAMPAVS